MAFSIFKGLGKLGVGAGALYVSVDLGLWGSSVDGAASMNRLTGTLQRQDEYLRQIPSSEQIASNVRQGWNSGVQWTFSSIAAAPEKAKDLGYQAVGYVTGSDSK